MSSSSSRPELKLDKGDETGFIAFYRSLLKKVSSSSSSNSNINSEINNNNNNNNNNNSSRIIRIFDRGDFYTAHYDDAIYIAQIVYRTLSVVKYLGGSSGGGSNGAVRPFEKYDKGLPSVTLSQTVFQSFLKDALLNFGHKVEIYSTATSAATGAGAGANNWKVIKQASPGNLLEVEDLLGNQIDQSPVVISLKIQSKSATSSSSSSGGSAVPGGVGNNISASSASSLPPGAGGGGRIVGICFIDSSTREIGVFEFLDNDLFSNLESVIIQLGVKECVIPQIPQSATTAVSNGGSSSSSSSGTLSISQDALDLIKVVELLDRCDVAITERKSSEFNTRDIEQDLSKLLSPSSIPISALPALSSPAAMSATAALIKYLGLMTQPDMFERFAIVQHDLSQYMKLDSSAIKALNLMPSGRDSAAALSATTLSSTGGASSSSVKSMSLFGLLNRCKTAAGTRLLGQWLKQPLMDVQEIESRHTLVETFVEDSFLRQTLQDDSLHSVPDIPRLARKLQRNSASLEDVVRIYQMIIRLPDLLSALDSVKENIGNDDNNEKATKAAEEIFKTYTSKIQEAYTNLEKLQELVETTVDLEALDNHEFIIKSDFDDRLKEIRERLEELRSLIDDEHLRAGDDLGMDPEKKLKLENHHVFGWCFRLTRTDASCLRSHSGYIELSTQKAGVYFTSRSLKSSSQEFGDLTQEYNKTQSGLVKEVVAIVATYTPVLENLSLVLAHLDVIVSFAHAASYAPIPYVRPKMHPRGTGRIILKEARHPCLEAQDDMRFIPNDVRLVRDESEFLIITGPNMGGKSTYIRQIGVIVLMAQIGSFVPCSYDTSVTATTDNESTTTTATAAAGSPPEISVCDSILARVGAGDSQLKGVSTFMAEMLETASILKSATQDSLIVIDELGRGTSTYDGFGLAWAITEHIVKNIGCFGMFATHFQELTGLADLYPKSVTNLHVVAHVREVDTRLAMETSHSSNSKDIINNTNTNNNGDSTEGNSSNNDDSDVFSSPSIALLYKVEPGISDQSFGIHVAEVVHFPKKVIRMAKRKALELEDFERDTTTITDSTTTPDVDGDDNTQTKTKHQKTNNNNNSKSSSSSLSKLYSNEEIHEGTKILKNLLKAWATTTTISTTNNNNQQQEEEKLTSSQILKNLNNLLINGDGDDGNENGFKEKIQNNAYLRSIMGQL